MKLVKNIHKAWSVWGLGLIAMIEGIKGSWPILSQQLPGPIYDYGLFFLAIAVLGLRMIDQGLNDDE